MHAYFQCNIAGKWGKPEQPLNECLLIPIFLFSSLSLPSFFLHCLFLIHRPSKTTIPITMHTQPKKEKQKKKWKKKKKNVSHLLVFEQVAPLEIHEEDLLDVEEQLRFLHHVIKGAKISFYLPLLKGSFSSWIWSCLGIPVGSHMFIFQL